MPWGMAAAAGISALGSIGGGLIGAGASSSAAKAQIAAQTNALNWIKQVYGNAQTGLNPYITAGQGAIGALSGFYGLPGGNPGGAIGGFQNFTNTPFYQFPLQQANLATNRALAASGLTNSGGALRDLSQINAGYASRGLGQYLGDLTGIANSGQDAVTNLGKIGAGVSGQIGALGTGIGNASAQGIYNSADSVTGAINSLLPQLTGIPNYGQGQTSYGPSAGGIGGGLIGQLYGQLYNPISSLFTYGNTGSNPANTAGFTSGGLGFLPPSLNGSYSGA